MSRGIRWGGRRRSRGQSLAEFALVAPIFLLLLFTVIELGLVMAAQNGLVDGVRTAARRAATYRINEASFDATVFPQICTSVRNELTQRLRERVVGYNGGNLTSTVSWEWEPNPQSGDYFLVAHISATYNNPLHVPFVAAVLDRSDGTVDNRLTLSAGEQMRVENPALDTPLSMTAHTC